MHARDLAELAAHLALANDQLKHRPRLLTDDEIERLEHAHHERSAAWIRAATEWRESEHEFRAPRESWRRFQKIVDEILLGEVLLRILGAQADCHAEYGGDPRLAEVLDHCLERHESVRSRVWSFFTLHGQFPGDIACSLEIFERSIASWTDLLLAHFDDAHVAVEWSHDARRLVEFRTDLAHEVGLLSQRTREDLLIEALRATVRDGAGRTAANPGLNRHIADLVAHTFGLPTDRPAQYEPLARPPRWEQIDVWGHLAAS